MVFLLSSIRRKILFYVMLYFILSSFLLILLYQLTKNALFYPAVLVVFLAVLGISALIFFALLARAALGPVREIEENLKQITKGSFNPSYLHYTDTEFRSVNDVLKKISLYLSHEIELRQKQMIHTEKLASLGTFLSGIAHELVNPLSNIYSSSQILLEEIDNPDKNYQKELIEQIEQESGRARNIARSLLEFSRERDVRKELLPLKGVFEETIRFIGGQKPTGIEIILDLPDALQIYVDKQRIQQAFLNIIKNAIESIPGRGTITIVAREGKEEGYVDITITDTGAGIDSGILSKIFEAFFTTKDIGKGSGLGLFITHEIISENNGTISAESQIGKGTTFLITLPGKEQEDGI